MEKIDHKKIDKEVFGIISEDIKKHEFIWKEDLNKWILSEQARIEAAARGGYKLGQLVHLAREDMLMTLAPDDITGVPFTGSASRRDCDPGSIIAGLKLPFPLFAANMESVTDEKLAITTALMGGVGILHQFQTVKKQVKQIRAVKNTAVKKITIDSRTYEPAIDPKGRLLVAGASGLRNNYTERIEKMVKAEVDIIVLDVAHGDSVQMYKVIKEIREKFPDTILAAGNIITPKAA